MASRELFTIGYEGSTIEDFIATLALTKIKIVLDIRDVPVSRKPGFSKKSLGETLALHGIEYLHLKGLGDPKPGRDAARAGRHDQFRAIFGAHLDSDAAQTDLARAIEAAAINPACLLCFERDHHHCHRLMVAERMQCDHDFRLRHIGVKSGLATTRTNAASHARKFVAAHVG